MFARDVNEPVRQARSRLFRFPSARAVQPVSVTHLVALAGVSGCGKTTVAESSGFAHLQLDSFFRAADDPAVPLRGGRPDWEDLQSFHLASAIQAVATLLSGGCAPIPIYDYRLDRTVGATMLGPIAGSILIADGTFAFDVADGIAMEHAAVTRVLLTRSRLGCAVGRIVRDYKEKRLSIVGAGASSMRLAMRHRDYLAAYQERADRTVTSLELQRYLRELGS